MSKISEEMLQQQADEFELELSYKEWWRWSSMLTITDKSTRICARPCPAVGVQQIILPLLYNLF